MDFVTLYHQRMNVAKRSGYLPTNYKSSYGDEDLYPLLVVPLPKFYSKLWLSNYYFAKNARQGNFLRKNKIKLVINLSGFSTNPKNVTRKQVFPRLYRRNSRGIQHVNLTLDDSEEVPTHIFRENMLMGAVLMEEAVNRQEGILIHCAAGINRSVSLILTWLILYGSNIPDGQLNSAIDYIRQQKAKYGFSSWDTLTNRHFYMLLKNISSPYLLPRKP